ncbi:MAG TPA: dipeptidase PepE [Thermoanaerobaculia bacterium]|jgi:dipeptidase E|nr:dipeptidase PepE [Thermoanaerobaculia bacterium]
MRLLLISSSVVHGYGYLDHAEPEIRSFLGGVKRVAFVPFALFDRDAYTTKVRERLGRMGFDVTQVRGRAEIDHAESIFVGGGNTFRLLKTLYDLDLIDAIRNRVRGGTLYMGSSAGSVITAPTIKTTNDMPIVQPRSFDALNFVPYQINGHYLDADPKSTHQGETRELRLAEYLEENAAPVIGIREGTMLRVEDGITTVVGTRPARIFRRGATPFDVEVRTRLAGDLKVVGRGS